MIKLMLERTYLLTQTLGTLRVFKNDELVGVLSTLELPYLDNKKQISCIPNGLYPIRKYTSEKFKNVFEIFDVPNRDKILIHNGNFNKDTHGCILVGMRHVDIDDDDIVDVAESSKALNFLRAVTKNETEIELQIV